MTCTFCGLHDGEVTFLTPDGVELLCLLCLVAFTQRVKQAGTRLVFFVDPTPVAAS